MGVRNGPYTLGVHDATEAQAGWEPREAGLGRWQPTLSTKQGHQGQEQKHGAQLGQRMVVGCVAPPPSA